MNEKIIEMKQKIKSLHNIRIEGINFQTLLMYNLNTNHITITTTKSKSAQKQKSLHSVNIEGIRFCTNLIYNINTDRITITNGKSKSNVNKQKSKIRQRDRYRVRNEISNGYEIHHLWYSDKYNRDSFVIISKNEHTKIHTR